MAVYFNLAVDCADNELLATALTVAYDGLAIQTRTHGEIVCAAEHIKPRRHWGQAG